MMTNDQKEEYRQVVARANGDQQAIDQVYNGVLTQLAEQTIIAKLEGSEKDLILDLIIIQDIIEMTAEIFKKTTKEVNVDLLTVTEQLPIDDIQQAYDLKQTGRLH